MGGPSYTGGREGRAWAWGLCPAPLSGEGQWRRRMAGMRGECYTTHHGKGDRFESISGTMSPAPSWAYPHDISTDSYKSNTVQ